MDLKQLIKAKWKMRTHGKSKRRTWRKLPLAVNRDTHEIVSIELTKSNVHDSVKTKALLDQVEKVAALFHKKPLATKEGDNKNAYEPIAAKKARAIIPPRSGAALKLKNISWGDVERNRILKENHLLGKKSWKRASSILSEASSKQRSTATKPNWVPRYGVVAQIKFFVSLALTIGANSMFFYISAYRGG